jgi:hypothetical protein
VLARNAITLSGASPGRQLKGSGDATGMDAVCKMRHRGNMGILDKIS